ncbi:MAG: hypothetical protein HC882_06660, partial [Acidobacteria bacterium]|nr:hypothetical protein [Acidobacteriota bacterium]
AVFSHMSRFHGEAARFEIDGGDCRLFKPDTWMNESGRAVVAIRSYYDIDPSQILIAHDEIDLPVGEIRLANSSTLVDCCLTVTPWAAMPPALRSSGVTLQVSPGSTLRSPSPSTSTKGSTIESKSRMGPGGSTETW